LREKTVPEMEREVRISGAKAGNEVIFPGANRAFGSIAAVNAGGSELEVNVLSGHVGLKSVGSFVVESLEFWAEATRLEESDGAFIGVEDGRASSVGHGFDVNVVAIVVIEDKHVGIAGAGGSEEAASLIGEYLASDGFAGGVEEMGAKCRWISWNGVHVGGRGRGSHTLVWGLMG
jgi:hypothetical protein